MLDTSMMAVWPTRDVVLSHRTGSSGSVVTASGPVQSFETSAMVETTHVVSGELKGQSTMKFDVLCTSACEGWCMEQVERRKRSFMNLLESSVIQGWGKSSWREQVAAEISAYALRASGWDGYSAKMIDSSAIADAVAFVRQLSEDLPPPLDQPCSDGEVSLVWRRDKCFAEIGFSGDETFWWYCTDGKRESSGEGMPLEFGIPAELGSIMSFPAEESAQLIGAPWGELFHFEYRLVQEIETSHAPPTYACPASKVQFFAAA